MPLLAVHDAHPSAQPEPEGEKYLHELILAEWLKNVGAFLDVVADCDPDRQFHGYYLALICIGRAVGPTLLAAGYRRPFFQLPAPMSYALRIDFEFQFLPAPQPLLILFQLFVYVP
ncbi:MAG: Uncharacterised protein [Cellvibrionales bacterium UBA7375]|nr:MAG: Uncharacterised protein [Cellvibrionales bacterium UBA7375]